MPGVRKHSRKRDAIWSLLEGTKEHPSADWIYERLKPIYPDLSLATVYRNLALFREEKQAIVVGTVNGQERFDADTSPHAHFICECCGRIQDVDVPWLEEALEKLPDVDGVITGHSLTLYGRCGNCR